MFLTNVQSLRPKIDDLHALAASIKPDIFILCETWLTPDIQDIEVDVPAYGSPLRCDRTDGRRGGGVCVYIKRGIPAFEIEHSSGPSGIEHLWVNIPKSKVIILAIYVPPNLRETKYKEISDYIISTSEDIMNKCACDKLIIAGDLNQLPCTTLYEVLGLTQVVQSPTRKDSILDKILLDTYLQDHYLKPVVGPNLGNADHRSVYLQPVKNITACKEIHKVYDFRDCHMRLVHNKINSYPWHLVFKSDACLQEKTDTFYAVLREALTVLPVSFVEISDNDKPWITPVLKRMINLRFESYRKRNFPVYNHLKSKVKMEISKAKSRWMSKIQTKQMNPWKVVNILCGTKSKNGDSLNRLIDQFESKDAAVAAISSFFLSSRNSFLR